MANGTSPVGPHIAAVIATTSGRSAPATTISRPNTSVQVAPALAATGFPVVGSKAGGECICSAVVGLRRRVAVALPGHAVHQHRAAESRARRSAISQRLDVVPVDRADVLQAEVLRTSPAAGTSP